MNPPVVPSKRGAACLEREELGSSSQVWQLPYVCFNNASIATTHAASKYESEISDECHSQKDKRHKNPNIPLALSHNSTGATRLISNPPPTSNPQSHPRPPLTIWQISNDSLRAPTLAAKSLDLQTREMFNTSLCTVLIPATFAAFAKRVDQDIIGFVRDDQRAQCPLIEWTVRCYATWHLASIHNDAELLAQSRYIYGVLMRYVRSALDEPRRRTSEITLIVATLLGIYEVFDGSSPGSWLVHVRGVKEILRRRGAAVHFSGFSRTILLSCRALLIAEAFASCEECFLAEAEWVSVSARAFDREERQGRGCRLVSLIDRTYREVVRVPGLVARTRGLIEAGAGGGYNGGGGGGDSTREELRSLIQRSQAALRRLRQALASLSRPEDGVTPKDNGESMIDPRFISTITQHNFHAVCAAEELLGRLSAILADTKQANPAGMGLKPREAIPNCPTAGKSISCETSPALRASHDSTTLDYIFLTLGVLAL
ncbi:hypothetical protein BJY01DRAFT_253702 [Aspergillus pseudoustus]|uniref:Fungal-specific transcription factor domain-containing protein n=1 Tax=Aspergillus pseudoustus TaxID=1810923 RepID=A0ABR4IYC0_9EURO